MFEDLSAVIVAQSSASHHSGYSLRLEKYLRKVDDGHLKGFVTGDLRLSLEEALGRRKSKSLHGATDKNTHLNFSS